MNPTKEEFRKLWVEALRSGKFPQGKESLNKNGLFCCMGVACEIYNQWFEDRLEISKLEISHKDNKDIIFQYDSCCSLPPKKVVEALGLTDKNGPYDMTFETHKNHTVYNLGAKFLTTDNDYNNFSFNKIADIIEKEPEGLFVDYVSKT